MDIISQQDLKARLKEGAEVLWPYRGEVEQGEVQFVQGDIVHVIWLEGYKSRNDSVALNDILSIHDKKGYEHKLGAFRGKGYLTAAGEKWMKTENAKA